MRWESVVGRERVVANGAPLVAGGRSLTRADTAAASGSRRAKQAGRLGQVRARLIRAVQCGGRDSCGERPIELRTKAWRALTRRTVVGVAVCSFAPLAFTGAAAAAVTSSSVAAARVYRDAVGDAKGGPDLRSVTISDTGGVVELVLKVGVKAPAGGASAPLVLAFFDTDGDGSAEYRLSVEETPTSTNWCLASAAAKSKCLGSRTLQFSGSGGTYTLRAASADLAGAAAFDFWVKTATITKSGDTTSWDDSPTNWSYTLRSVKLLLGAPVLSPATPVAAQLFTMTVPVNRSDGVPLPSGKGTRASVSLPSLDGNAVIPDDFNEQLTNAGLRVSFTLPADAAGKLLKLSVSAMSGQMALGMPGVSGWALNASRSYSWTVAAPKP